jgi:pimeloyl-ACP methyl ester carboxylesterase
MEARRIITIALFIAALGNTSCWGLSVKSGALSTGFVNSRDGVPIYFETVGNGPTTIVFVHGWTCDRTYWSRQRDTFAASYRVVTLDLAGHGKSGLGRKDYTMAAFGADVAAVLTALNPRRVVLVGHSMGSAVVVETAKLVRDRVIGLVAVDAFHTLEQFWTPASVAAFVKPFREDYVRAARPFVESMFLPTSDRGLVHRITTEMLQRPPEVGISALEQTRLWQTTYPFDGVAVPMVAINSDRQPTDKKSLERRGMKAVIMSGVGHFPMIEDAVTFNRLLAAAVQEFELAALGK